MARNLSAKVFNGGGIGNKRCAFPAKVPVIGGGNDAGCQLVVGDDLESRCHWRTRDVPLNDTVVIIRR